ncbi:MAG: hypothetical protein ACJ72N_27620 [Labedaea sp.]
MRDEQNYTEQVNTANAIEARRPRPMIAPDGKTVTVAGNRIKARLEAGYKLK